VTSWNYRRFVTEAVDSALSQTHPDVEVIVVDDGSVDGSIELLRQYGDHIQLLEQANAGQAAACTTGYRRSTGEAVLFLDADDILEPNALSVAFHALRDGDAKVQFRLRLVDAQGRPLGRTHPSLRELPFVRTVCTDLLDHGRYPSSMTSGNLYPRGVLEQVMPIPTDTFRDVADGYLNAAVAFEGRVRFIDDVLGSYRLHDSNRWSVARLDPDRLRRGLLNDRNVHRLVRRLADEGNKDSRDDLDVRDEYHLRERLGSLRLDRDRHPMPGDTVWLLTRAGVRAALRGRHTGAVRWRNAAWFLLVAAGPRSFIRRFVPRAIGAR
jgi:glycosyltransferase involved in cell wall biosynthesis